MADVIKIRKKRECDWSHGLDFTNFHELDIALDRYDDCPFENGPSARAQLHKMADRVREYERNRASRTIEEFAAQLLTRDPVEMHSELVDLAGKVRRGDG